MSGPFHSERLVYRAPEVPEDIGFYSNLRSDHIAEGNAHSKLLRPHSHSNIEAMLRKFQENPLLSVIICLPIERPADRDSSTSLTSVAACTTPIGLVGVRYERDVHHRTASIHIQVDEKYRGKGYGTEAIKWILQWGFEIAGLHRIGIGALSYNIGAVKLYERLGFRHEATKKETIWFNDGWHDVLEWAMLEDEWKVGLGRRQGVQSVA